MIGLRSYLKGKMVKKSLFAFITASLLFLYSNSFAEKLYVVERERDSLSIIEDERITGIISGVGNTNHALMKFYRDYGYVITRDGFISKIDIQTNKLLKSVKVGESTIGLDFSGEIIAVANYDPKNVVFLDLDLKIIKTIETGSKNVGIKGWGDFIIFSLMEKDEIWVINVARGFSIEKVLRDVGPMPFDALMKDGIYLVGFFKDSSIGMLDLRDMKYIRKEVSGETKDITFKIPHFGTWGIVGEKAFIPAVGEKRLHIVALNEFQYKGFIELMGLPVFAVVSPDGRYIAVNYSGDKDDYITIVEPVKLSVLQHIKAGKRILHMRFSRDGKRLFLSSYFENRLKFMNTDSWRLETEIEVPTPSGIFIP